MFDRERVIAAAVDWERVLHSWALETAAGGASRRHLKRLSVRMISDRRKWVSECCRSMVKEKFDRNRFSEWTFEDEGRRAEVAELAAAADPSGWRAKCVLMERCREYLRRVEGELVRIYGRDWRLVREGGDFFLELDFNGLYASIMYAVPMPSGDGGVRVTADEAEARAWLEERRTDLPRLEWCDGGGLPASHYGLYCVDLDPPEGHGDMVASAVPCYGVRFKEKKRRADSDAVAGAVPGKKRRVDSYPSVEKAGGRLRWIYRRLRSEWLDSFTLNVAREWQGWRLRRVRAAVRWDHVEPPLTHTMRCLFKERQAYKKTNMPEADARKLVMNSCYGKFCEDDSAFGYTMEPADLQEVAAVDGARLEKKLEEKEGRVRLEDMAAVDFGRNARLYKKEGRFACVPQQVGNAITSGARALVHAMWGPDLRTTRREAERRGEFVCYQDTDNAYLTLGMADKWREKGGVGGEMGQVKNEFGEGLGVFALFPGRKNKLVVYAVPDGRGGFAWKHQFKWKGPRKDCAPWTLWDKTCCYQSALNGWDPPVQSYQAEKHRRTDFSPGESNFDAEGYVKNGVRLFVPRTSTLKTHETREGGVWVKQDDRAESSNGETRDDRSESSGDEGGSESSDED